MPEEQFDKTKGVYYGFEIGEIEKRILALPLESLRQELDKWESFTPYTDPTQFKTYSKLILNLKERVEILYTAKQQLKLLRLATKKKEEEEK